MAPPTHADESWAFANMQRLAGLSFDALENATYLRVPFEDADADDGDHEDDEREGYKTSVLALRGGTLASLTESCAANTSRTERPNRSRPVSFRMTETATLALPRSMVGSSSGIPATKPFGTTMRKLWRSNGSYWLAPRHSSPISMSTMIGFRFAGS